MTKKASEIILDIFDKVSFIVKATKSQSFDYKLILKRLDKIDEKLDYYLSENTVYNKPKDISSSNNNELINNTVIGSENIAQQVSGSEAIALKIKHAEQENKRSQFEQMKSQSGFVDDTQPTSIAGDDEGELFEATKFTGHRRGQRIDRVNSLKPVSVSQQLLDNNGKPLALATVKISDSNGRTVKTARSNTKGKWAAPLEPGVYEIYFLKKFVSDPEKKPVEGRYKISIPVSENKMELPPPDLKG